MVQKIRNVIQMVFIIFNIIKKRWYKEKLAVCISTPFYGNVGDHTIELAEQEIMAECGFANRILDISSYELKLRTSETSPLLGIV